MIKEWVLLFLLKVRHCPPGSSCPLSLFYSNCRFSVVWLGSHRGDEYSISDYTVRVLVCVFVAQGGGGLGVSWLATLLDLCHKGRGGCPLAKEADRAYFKSKPLTGFPKVIQHDIDDGHLVDARSVNFHHRFRISLLQLKQKETNCMLLLQTVLSSIVQPVAETEGCPGWH